MQSFSVQVGASTWHPARLEACGILKPGNPAEADAELASEACGILKPGNPAEADAELASEMCMLLLDELHCPFFQQCC
jgi:hypothetical protein